MLCQQWSDGCRPDRAERVPACSTAHELPELAGARSGLRNTIPHFKADIALVVCPKTGRARFLPSSASVQVPRFLRLSRSFARPTRHRMRFFGSFLGTPGEVAFARVTAACRWQLFAESRRRLRDVIVLKHLVEIINVEEVTKLIMRRATHFTEFDHFENDMSKIIG